MLRIFTALLFILYTTGSYSQQPNSDWKILDGSFFSIKYPADWELDQSGQFGSTFFIFSPVESAQDQFKENINFMKQDLTGYNLDMDKYVEITEEQLKTLITNGAMIESKRIKTESSEYHQIIYTGDQEIYHLKFVAYMWLQNEKAYVLTFTAEQTTFEKYKETGEAILNSFILK